MSVNPLISAFNWKSLGEILVTFTSGRSLRFWRRHTAGQSRDGFQHVWSGRKSGTTLIIGLLYEPLGVHTVTTRTFPSFPGCTLVILAKGHLVGMVGSSRRHTMSLTCRFSVGSCHFANRFRVIRYSFDHLFQKWLVRFWQRFHLRSIEIGRRDSGGSGKAVNGFPMRKWPGVSTSIPSDSSGRGVSGLEFRQASICVKVVASSS